MNVNNNYNNYYINYKSATKVFYNFANTAIDYATHICVGKISD